MHTCQDFIGYDVAINLRAIVKKSNGWSDLMHFKWCDLIKG
jgi:hypothetical protein